MRIGRLSIHLLSGKYVVEDMTIDGLRPGDRPFFTAKRIAVAMDWSTAMRRQPEFLITSVEMTDWNMLVEKWEGAHNFPKFTRDNPSQGPRRFTTHAQVSARASRPVHVRGSPVAVEHRLPQPRFHASATCRTTTAKRSSPAAPCRFRTTSRCGPTCARSFVIDGPHVELDRIEFDTDGAKTVARGSVELGKRWPEQSYDFESRVQFPRMNDIFFADQNWDLTGDGDVIGRFRLFKGGHDLSGTFKSDVLGWNDYRFPELSGALHWTPKAFDVTERGGEILRRRRRSSPIR